jgi:hypothetical protein
VSVVGAVEIPFIFRTETTLNTLYTINTGKGISTNDQMQNMICRFLFSFRMHETK